MSLISVIFFNLFIEHLLSPAPEHKIRLDSALNNKLLTIAPTSHFREFDASIAVLAVSFKTTTFDIGSKSLRALSALLTVS